MLGLQLMPGLLWVHNNNYMYHGTSKPFFFPPSPSNMTDARRRTLEPLCIKNVVPHDLWINFQWSAANYLRISYLYHILQIHYVDYPSGSFCRVSCFPIIDDHTNSYYKTHCLFYGVQYLLDLLHKCHQLSLEFFTWKILIQNFS